MLAKRPTLIIFFLGFFFLSCLQDTWSVIPEQLWVICLFEDFLYGVFVLDPDFLLNEIKTLHVSLSNWKVFCVSYVYVFEDN